MDMIVAYPKSGGRWLARMLNSLGFDIRSRHAGYGHGPSKRFTGFGATDLGGLNHLVAQFRDPRDTLVSGYYQCTVRTTQFVGTMRQFISHPGHGIERNVLFNLALMDAVALHRNARSTTYEAISADTAGTLQRVVGFFGLRLLPEQAALVLPLNSFEMMRKRELAGEFIGKSDGEKEIAPRLEDPNSMLFRRGIVGSHRDEMTADDIALCDEVLAHHDYFERLARHLEGHAV